MTIRRKNSERMEQCQISIDRNEMRIGLLAVACGLFMPFVLNVETFGIYRELGRAIRTSDGIFLMWVAVKLVLLNALRGIPHYVGAFFLGESLRIRWKKRILWAANAVFIFTLLILIYYLIGVIHEIHYDFGIPAVMASLFEIFFNVLGYQHIAQKKKALLISLVLTAFQFLDIMPMVSVLPVGRGEISVDIKLAAVVMDSEFGLNGVALIGMLLFLSFGMVVLFQLRDENNLRELAVLREQNEHIRTLAQINEMQNRTYQEMRFLVHDLKSPLTSVQTLTGIIKMECQIEGRERDIAYLTRIENAVEQMSRMISEIIYEDQRSPMAVNELLDAALAQSSISDYAAFLQIENTAGDAKVCANRILFSRAIVNLLQNSGKAVAQKKDPKIYLRVYKDRTAAGNSVVFSVKDNGRGIEQTSQQKIWLPGFSESDSSGLGLPFVRSVVEKMEGTISVSSTVGEGTEVLLRIPEEKNDGENRNNTVD